MEPTTMEFSHQKLNTDDNSGSYSNNNNQNETLSSTMISDASIIIDSTTDTSTESSLSLSHPIQPLPQKGIAGRINYAQWDKVTKDLVTQIDEESQQETIEEKKKVRFSFALI